ncbi:uncharacterized protein LOC141700662 [Apium graveolens]|uniref:uncharacterized protein LOC141700662 n=1 Tax=Apium graveolens TaxID=4045 RepID=UPI003D7B18F1
MLLKEDLTQEQVEAGLQDLTLFMDASISTSSGMVGLGAVIFKANKKIQASLSKPLEGNLNVFHAEALALLVGLRWVQMIGLPVKFFFSDSLSMVQALNNTNAYHNELGILLSDIKILLTEFPEASVSHVNRSYNVVAHNLAKQALVLDAEVSWVDDLAQHTDNQS